MGRYCTLCENEELTEKTRHVENNNVNFPLRIKGTGRYILDSNNTVIGKYFSGETTEILDLMNKMNTIYPINEGIMLTSREWSDNCNCGDNMYRRGDEILYIKVS